MNTEQKAKLADLHKKYLEFSEYLREIDFIDQCHKRCRDLQKIWQVELKAAGLVSWWGVWEYLHEDKSDFSAHLCRFEKDSVIVSCTMYDYDDTNTQEIDLNEDLENARLRIREEVLEKSRRVLSAEGTLDHMKETG